MATYDVPGGVTCLALSGGFNPAAVVAFAAGVAPNIPGFLKTAGVISTCPACLQVVYGYAWWGGAGSPCFDPGLTRLGFSA